jgi:hypothetical protein
LVQRFIDHGASYYEATARSAVAMFDASLGCNSCAETGKGRGPWQFAILGTT